MDMFDLAGTLFGNRRNTVAQGSTLTATGSTASTDGIAGIVIDADVTPAEGTGDEDVDQTIIDLPTSPDVAEGDEVIVTLVGDGPLKTPIVTANPGSGDRMAAAVQDAHDLAASVESIAQEAAADVEQVRQDVADFRSDVATTYATKVERQDGDDAVKTWVTTNYTNSNDLATTYATKTLVSQTKDAIELAASQTYETQSDAAETYATKSALTVGLDGIRSEVAEDYQPKGDYATTASMNSAIQQSASSIESSVAATYTTKAEFEGLQVGATNLAKGTSATTEKSGTLASTGVAYLDVCTYTIKRIEGATEYVVSFEAYASAACEVNCYWYSPNTTTKASSSTGQSGTNADGRCEVTLTTGWKRYWVKWTQSDSAATDKRLIVCRILKPSSGSLTVHVRAVKMETGNMPTDWSPAPEDMATTYATKTEVQQTASGLDTRITTAQSTADGAASTASTAAGNAATALSTANDALADSVEYIIGTQTAATNAWTGQTRDAALVAGKTIAYKLPYAGTGTAATLNLTLSGGGTTGAKGVRRMADNNANYTVTTQYGAGAVLQMTYDGEYWRVSSGYNPTTDINNARYRTQIPSAVKAAAAYTTGHIICGTSAGYKNIGAGVAFDLGYPLLYAAASVAAGATGTANYLEFENRNASTNGTIQSGAANKTLYLKGTVSGNTFTIAASPFMTTVTPTSEDGFCYIPLGLMYSATNIYFQSSDQLYAYTEGAFQPIGRGALATAQAEVTERQTLIRQFSGGVLAGYVGNAIAALVNAAGSFDVVRTAWSGGVPSILGTLATFGANLIRIGEETGQNVLVTSAGQFFRDGLNNLLSLTTGATYTETFQIRSDEDHYELTYHPMVVESVTIDGTATSDYTWTNSGYVVGSGKLGTLVLGYDTWQANPGATLSVTYRTSPAMTVWDGLGNLAANVMSYFTADEIGLGGNIFSDPHGTSRGAAVRFFGATDEQGASLTSGIQRDSGSDYISYVDEIGLTGTTTDADAVSPNGCIADYGIKASGYLYDDPERSNDYRAESTAILYARSRSSDDYDAADARAQLGVKTVTIGDNYERSYVTLVDGFGSDADVPMEQAIATFGQLWRTLGTAGSGGRTFTLPHAGTWLLVTGHNSTASLNTVWIVRTGGNKAFNVGAGGTATLTVTVSGTSVTVKTNGGTVSVLASYIG